MKVEYNNNNCRTVRFFELELGNTFLDLDNDLCIKTANDSYLWYDAEEKRWRLEDDAGDGTLVIPIQSTLKVGE